MRKVNVVRADFYSNGKIVPLGITDNLGNTKYIDRILQSERQFTSKGSVAFRFVCTTKEEKFILLFKNGQWILKD